MTTATGEAQDVFAFRKAARRRAWVCPGAGFAMLGWKKLALFSYFCSLATFIGGIATALHPRSETLWTTVALLAVGTFLWLAEVTTTYSAWPGEGDRSAGSRYRVGAALLVLAAAGFAAAMLLSFKMIKIQGDTMEPTVWNDDRLLYHRLVDESRLQRGAVILFQLPPENNFTEPGTIMIGRIMAVPGDEISASGFRYRVNGKVEREAAIDTTLPKAFSVPPSPKTLTVPEGCYFVTQDSNEAGLDSQVLGWARRDRIVSTRMFQISRKPFLAQVE